MSELADPFENEGGKGGPPVISWKKVVDPSDGGNVFKGVVMAADVDLPEKGYRVIQEMSRNPGDDDGPLGLMFWPPNSSDDRRPVTEARYLALGGDRAEMTPVPKTEVFLTTGFRKFEFVSANAKSKMVDAEKADEGDRRVIVGGKDLKPKIMAALKAIGAKRPEVGQAWEITLEARIPKPGKPSESTSQYKVVIAAPTQDTLQVAKEARARVAAAAAESEFGDPWGTAPAASSGAQDDPPF